MKNGGKILLGCSMAALNLVICAQTNAIVTDSSGNPYHGIIERNVFALKPLPPPVDPKDLIKKPDAPKITLTGITTILHKKQVLMNVQMPAKPPEPAKQQSFIITEGQRDGDIEVLEIDEKTGSVRLNNFGTPMTLTMEKDGAKLPASAPAAPPQLAGAAPNIPNAAGYTPQRGMAESGKMPIPVRQLRVPTGENQAAAPNTGLAMATPNNPYGTVVANNPYGTTAPGIGMARPQVPNAPVTGEEAAINMLSQHLANTAQGVEMPPLPPPLQEVLEDPHQQQQTTPAPQTRTPTFPPRSPALPPLPQ